jgi:hypothetical protein
MDLAFGVVVEEGGGAIWLRPALWTQTNRTSGTSLMMAPSAWARARSCSRRSVHEQGDEVDHPGALEPVDGLVDVAFDGLQ